MTWPWSQLFPKCQFPKCWHKQFEFEELSQFRGGSARTWLHLSPLAVTLKRSLMCGLVCGSLCLHTAQQCVVTARVITCPVSFTQPACSLALSCVRNWHTVITMSLGPTLCRSLHTFICSSYEQREKCAIHAHFCKPWNMMLGWWQVLS